MKDDKKSRHKDWLGDVRGQETMALLSWSHMQQPRRTEEKIVLTITTLVGEKTGRKVSVAPVPPSTPVIFTVS